jgi:esterase
MNALRLHFESVGQGEPLLIVHGLFGSLENWASISRALADQFRVVAVDQRNHGRSPHSPVMSFRCMAEDLRQLLDGLGLTRCHLLGHSLGGKAVMEFALLHPGRTSKLVVVDIAPRAYPPRHESILRALLGLAPGSFTQRQAMDNALAERVPDLATRRFLLKNAVRGADGTFHWRMGLQELWTNYARLREPLTSPRPSEAAALFVRGEHSEYLSEPDLVEIRLFPRARLASVARAGHLPHTENPEAFLKVVREFLRP